MSKVEALAPGPAPRTANWRAQLPTLIRVYGIVLTLLLLLTVVTIGNPAFISQQNVFNMASQWAPAGIMAVGMTFVILTGGFDLSVASAYSLCAVVAAYVGQTHAPWVAFAAAKATLEQQSRSFRDRRGVDFCLEVVIGRPAGSRLG